MSVATQPDVRTFLENVWGQQEGVAYVAFAERAPGADRVSTWDRSFYAWPQDSEKLYGDIMARRVKEEVYFAPALFYPRGKQTAGKEDVLGAQVVWVDFDGDVPTDLKGVAPPTIRVQSSPGHEHWYWKIDTVAEVAVLERINRALAYLFHADSSGWDANQVLRPIDTFNHKRKCAVTLIESVDTALPVGFFDGIPQPPPLPAIPQPEDIPDVEDVVFKHPVPQKVSDLFRSHQTEPGRGKALMFLGYSFAELNLTNAEILSLLMHADERWGKFFGRADRMKRLMEIVTISRAKYPYRAESTSGSIEFMGFETLLATEINLEWIWEGWLQKGGYMLLTGPPGVGKTQFSLYVGCMMALGKDAFGQRITEPRKIGFFSLEMGLTDIKMFMMLLGTHFTAEDRDILEQNFLVVPMGEPLYVNRDEVKARVEDSIRHYKLDGIMFDSLSSMSEGDVKDEKTVKSILDWNDHIRQAYGVFTWIVHHHRKATSDNRKPNKLDDVYGPYLITARATTVFCLWPSQVANALEVIPLKVRLSSKPASFYIRREPTLAMSRVSNAAVTMTAKEENIVVVDEPIQPGGKPSFGI